MTAPPAAPHPSSSDTARSRGHGHGRADAAQKANADTPRDARASRSNRSSAAGDHHGHAHGSRAKLDGHGHGSRASTHNTLANDADDHVVAKRVADGHLRKHRERKFYVPAHRLLTWGEVQKGRHASWGDLFFDLVMVGAAFKVGDFFKKNINSVNAPLVLMGTGLTIVNTWSHLLQYRCRFEAKSIAHKIVDVLEGLCAAAAAHNVVSNMRSFELYHQYVFLTMVLFGRLVQLARRLELVLLPEPKDPLGSQRGAALDMLCRTLVEMALLSTGFAFDTIPGVMSVLIGTWVLQVLLFTIPAFMGWYRKKWLVPIHVEYTLSRMGEMIMLSLGEGMLSLVLTETTVETYEVETCDLACWSGKLKSALSFFSGFVVLTSLMWSYYRSNRFTRHHHAVRRSSMRGMAWNTSHWPLAVALIASGVCIKAIHPYAASGKFNRAYSTAFGVTCCFSMLTIAFQQVMHPGVGPFLFAPKLQRKRLGLFAIKVCFAVSMLAMLAFPSGTEGYVFMVYAAILSTSGALLVVLENSSDIERGLWFYADHAIGGKDQRYHSRNSIDLGQVDLAEKEPVVHRSDKKVPAATDADAAERGESRSGRHRHHDHHPTQQQHQEVPAAVSHAHPGGDPTRPPGMPMRVPEESPEEEEEVHKATAGGSAESSAVDSSPSGSSDAPVPVATAAASELGDDSVRQPVGVSRSQSHGHPSAPASLAVQVDGVERPTSTTLAAMRAVADAYDLPASPTALRHQGHARSSDSALYHARARGINRQQPTTDGAYSDDDAEEGSRSQSDSGSTTDGSDDEVTIAAPRHTRHSHGHHARREDPLTESEDVNSAIVLTG